jgi:hypothetical protein
MEDRSRPQMGAEIGRRLLAAGRTTEALATLENARAKQRADQAAQYDDVYLGGYGGDGCAWEEVYIEALDASGQGELAQQLRWAAFEQRLSSVQLRAYLKKLPDFEDVEAEERAMRHALGLGASQQRSTFSEVGRIKPMPHSWCWLVSRRSTAISTTCWIRRRS